MQKSIIVSGDVHRILRKEVFDVDLNIKKVVEFKLKKPLSKKEIKQIKSDEKVNIK